MDMTNAVVLTIAVTLGPAGSMLAEPLRHELCTATEMIGCKDTAHTHDHEPEGPLNVVQAMSGNGPTPNALPMTSNMPPQFDDSLLFDDPTALDYTGRQILGTPEMQFFQVG
jgi:hypothetical protein